MKRHLFKHVISLTVILSILLSLWSPMATGLFASAEYNEKHITEPIDSLQKKPLGGPFALMYDSDERLQQELFEYLSVNGLTTEENGVQNVDMPSFVRRADETGTLSSISSVLETSAEKVFPPEILMEQGVSEYQAREINQLISESGETRFIIKRKSQGLLRQGASLFSQYEGVEVTPFLEGYELATFPDRINPAELAAALDSYGASQYIEYIQPDFALTYDSLGISIVEDNADSDDLALEDGPDDSVSAEPAMIGEEEAIEEKETESEENQKQEYILPEMDPIIVAVVDTGLDPDHPLYADSLLDGWNFIEDNDEIFSIKTPNAAIHGTHVAGVIAQQAEKYNVPISILPLKVFEYGQAYTSDIIAAIEYANEQGVSMINCSFGSSQQNPALYECIANSKAFIVAAAGNSRRDLGEKPSYPASYDLPNVISVGSMNSDGGYSYFSNYGSDYVDIAALGREVESSLPGGGYGVLTGTSMSAAQVTGAAAVLQAYHPDLSAGGLKETLLWSADKGAHLERLVKNGNILNLDQAVGQVAGENRVYDYWDDWCVEGYQPEYAEFSQLHSSGGNIVQVQAGAMHSVALAADGFVWCWGDNRYGQLGDGTTISSTVPVRVIGLADVIKIASKGNHTLALKSDGTLWSWGANNCGQLGDGSRSNRSAPVQVIGISDVEKIDANLSHSLAITKNGIPYSWGSYTSGKIIDYGGGYGGETGFVVNWFIISAPQQVGTWNAFVFESPEVYDMSACYDGTIWLGENCFYLQGDNAREWDGIRIVEITESCVSHSIPYSATSAGGNYLLSPDGKLYLIDHTENYYCDGYDTQYFWANSSNTILQKNNGDIYIKGNNQYGQLGNGTSQPVNVWTQENALSTLNRFALGENHALAIDRNGILLGWGSNANGQLGNLPPSVLSPTILGMEIPISTYELKFSNSRNFFRIPEQGADQYFVEAKVYANGLEFERETEYQFAEPKAGASIESSTGRLIISSTAEEGTIIVKALSEDLETTAEVILYKSNSNTSYIQFPIEEGKIYFISIYGQALETPTISYQIMIGTENCQWADLCAFTPQNELTEGEINDTNSSINEIEKYSVTITHQLKIPEDYQWSGVINAIKITANKNGIATMLIKEI